MCRHGRELVDGASIFFTGHRECIGVATKELESRLLQFDVNR